MGKEIFISYWIGEEPDPPSPTLDKMPAYVDIVPLAFVGISKDYTLDFAFLTKRYPAETIQDWIRTIQAHGAKVLFSINDQKLGFIPPEHYNGFVENVVKSVETWGVDGIDFDFEPPVPTDTLVPLIMELRSILKPGCIFTAPVYSAWLRRTETQQLLSEIAMAVDYVLTMDYTPYPGLSRTLQCCDRYAQLIGGWEKLVIGMSCMNKPNNFTSLSDVAQLSSFVPTIGSKAGVMLYNFRYDVKTRPGGGTNHPDGTWTKTICENLGRAK